MRPSISMVLTCFSIAAMSVSSSQGLQSRRIDDLAMSAGFLDFFSAYAFKRSSLILSASASSSSSEPKRSTSSSSSFVGAKNLKFKYFFRNNVLSCLVLMEPILLMTLALLLRVYLNVPRVKLRDFEDHE